MEDRTLTSSTTTIKARPEAKRNVWVLTAYGVAGLGMMGILLYYFSTYVTH